MRFRRHLALVLSLALLATAVSGFAILETVHLVHNGRYGSLSPVCRVVTNQKVVALSFDDGPDPGYTPEVLALLHQYGDTATFFVTGAHAQLFPSLVADEVQAGMEVGDHTWSHPRLTGLSTTRANSEVARAKALLSLDGVTVRLFRAPFGEITADQLDAIEQMGLKPIHWSLALDHYVGGLGLAPGDAAASVLQDIRPGDIILAHDARLTPQGSGAGRIRAIATLRLLLPALRQRGFAVTTVEDLLRRGSAVQAEPRTWFWQTGFSCPRA